MNVSKIYFRSLKFLLLWFYFLEMFNSNRNFSNFLNCFEVTWIYFKKFNLQTLKEKHIRKLSLNLYSLKTVVGPFSVSHNLLFFDSFFLNLLYLSKLYKNKSNSFFDSKHVNQLAQ